jgi:DNA-binding response OmpR family regulator
LPELLKCCRLMSQPKHILVVDTDGDVREVITDLLLEAGFRVSVATSGETMRDFLQTSDPVDVIVLDASMGGKPPVSLALHAKELGVRLVMISGDPTKMEIAHERADQLLRKPFGQEELVRAVEAALASLSFGQRSQDPV